MQYDFARHVVATNYIPIFDARLACSIWETDKWKIDPVRKFLNIWGFDYSTLGLETQPMSRKGDAS